MACPKSIVFPADGKKTSRTLILRNPTLKDVVIKLVPSCALAIGAEGLCLLVHARRYAEVNISYDPAASKKKHQLAIYMRPIEAHNHAELRLWIRGSTYLPRQTVATLEILSSTMYSASQTLVDLPGGASLNEALTLATAGIDGSDTATCMPIDADTATADRLRPDEAARLAKEKMESERCWLFGPLIDMIFPPAEVTNSAINQEQNYTPCAGFA